MVRTFGLQVAWSLMKIPSSCIAHWLLGIPSGSTAATLTIGSYASKRVSSPIYYLIFCLRERTLSWNEKSHLGNNIENISEPI